MRLRASPPQAGGSQRHEACDSIWRAYAAVLEQIGFRTRLHQPAAMGTRRFRSGSAFAVLPSKRLRPGGFAVGDRVQFLLQFRSGSFFGELARCAAVRLRSWTKLAANMWLPCHGMDGEEACDAVKHIDSSAVRKPTSSSSSCASCNISCTSKPSLADGRDATFSMRYRARHLLANVRA